MITFHPIPFHTFNIGQRGGWQEDEEEQSAKGKAVQNMQVQTFAALTTISTANALKHRDPEIMEIDDPRDLNNLPNSGAT
jgi:hypothetical protein